MSWCRTEHERGEYPVKILHILKKAPDASTKKIIELHAAGNDVKTIELYKGGTSYDKLVADVFSYDKVFCW
jgi:hypothetical protein